MLASKWMQPKLKWLSTIWNKPARTRLCRHCSQGRKTSCCLSLPCARTQHDNSREFWWLCQPASARDSCIPDSSHLMLHWLQVTGIKRSTLLVRLNPSEGTRQAEASPYKHLQIIHKADQQQHRSLPPPDPLSTHSSNSDPGRHHHPKARVGFSHRRQAWELGTARINDT